MFRVLTSGLHTPLTQYKGSMTPYTPLNIANICNIDLLPATPLNIF